MTDSREPPSQAAGSDGGIRANIRCHKCGYNLRGLRTDDKCPECGFDIRETITALNTSWRRDGLLRLRAVVLIALAPPAMFVVFAFFAAVGIRAAENLMEWLAPALRPVAYLSITVAVVAVVAVLVKIGSVYHRSRRQRVTLGIVVIGYAACWLLTVILLAFVAIRAGSRE